MTWRFFRRLKDFMRDESGSAIVEFILLALPLFIPLFIFLNQYSTTVDTQSSMRTLSREMARAIVTSENDEVAVRVAHEVFIKAGDVLGFTGDIESGALNYSLSCRERPCISPNNEIIVIIRSRNTSAEISAVEFVSPWA